jgi:AmiR/NasT family two-component response regulator
MSERWTAVLLDGSPAGPLGRQVDAAGGAVIGAAADAGEAAELTARLRPDVLVAGPAGGARALEALRRLGAAAPALLVLPGAAPVRPLAALAVLRAQVQALGRRLDERKLIDRAKGRLMDRLGLSEAEAFRRIQKTAMDSRRTMADVARAVLGGDALQSPRSAGAAHGVGSEAVGLPAS